MDNEPNEILYSVTEDPQGDVDVDALPRHDSDNASENNKQEPKRSALPDDYVPGTYMGDYTPVWR